MIYLVYIKNCQRYFAQDIPNCNSAFYAEIFAFYAEIFAVILAIEIAANNH